MTLHNQIQDGLWDSTLSKLYGTNAVSKQRQRYLQALSAFDTQFSSDEPIRILSAPGRTELGGNHTDHQHGRVLAASVNLDVVAVASPSDSSVVHIQSAGYPLDTVDLQSLDPQDAEKNRSASLIRGVAAYLQSHGYTIGGFNAYTVSDVPKGSGLSSSAAFETLVGTIFSHLYNHGTIDPVVIAQAGQFAENVYFGKPSGLMDQMASSVGGIISIDFSDPQQPAMEKIPFDFAGCGYHLCIQETGGNHADLTHEYAAVPEEMLAIAASLGGERLRDVSFDALLEKLPELREKHGDRAVLRAIHFFEENQRVVLQSQALIQSDFHAFMKQVLASGHSSFEYLQNVYSSSNIRDQGVSVALALAQSILEGQGAWRVHGGGFGGTTQNFVPDALLDRFRSQMEKVYGSGTCHVLSIRPWGGIQVTPEL